MAKIMRKPLPPVMSWWSERRNLLTSLKPEPVRARPKIKKVNAKAKPKSIKAKKVVKAKEGDEDEEGNQGKERKGKENEISQRSYSGGL